MTNDELTHFTPDGAAHMVDVSPKPETRRSATASAVVTMRAETLAVIRAGTAAKGDVVGVARLAGIMAAKRTADLIPLCHPLQLTSVTVAFEFVGETELRILATAAVFGRTGVEMEALTAVSVAALTVVDMVKAVDRDLVIGPVRLEAKSGGRSGDYARPAPPVA